MLRLEDFKEIIDIGIALTTEKSYAKLLQLILEKGMSITNCDGGTLYLYKNDCLYFSIMKTISLGVMKGMEDTTDMPPVPYAESNVCAYSAIHRTAVNIPDVYHSDKFDFTGPHKYDALTGYHTQSLLVIPLENREGEIIGVLQLINAMDKEKNVIPFNEEFELIMHSLASQATVAISNMRYVKEIKDQLYSFVSAMATAIDEKTPYNGLHSRNVALYVELLAKYINKQHKLGHTELYFDDNHLEQLILAARVHDIGKMITPLDVMNKATRLEFYLGDIENRFKLLTAYYEIDLLKGFISKEVYQEKLLELKNALQLIKKGNLSTYLNDEMYDELKKISALSYTSSDGTTIPFLTSDERENLLIRKGTLNDNERIQMENHVVMTSKILNQVHFSTQYSMVPKWVGEHHEYLDGSGYPNHLSEEDISIETRILSIADVFDALTATDRPYKKAMSQEKALAILKDMAKQHKLDDYLVQMLNQALNV